MLFTIQIGLDWIDEDGKLDEVVEEKIIKAITESIIEKFSEKTSERMARNAEALVRAKTESLINSVLEQPITITTGWNKKDEYESIFSMVEEQLTALYKGKLDTQEKCVGDPLLKNIRQHVKMEADRLLVQAKKTIEITAKRAAKSEFEENALIKAIGAALAEKAPSPS